MVSVELLVIVLFRLVMGLALTSALGFLGWIMLRVVFPVANYNSLVFSSVAALLVGGSGSLGAIFAWWSTGISEPARPLCTVLTIALAALGSWIGLRLVRGNIHFEWISGVGTVPVIYQGDVFSAMVIATVIGANAVAGGFYFYRLLSRKEL